MTVFRRKRTTFLKKKQSSTLNLQYEIWFSILQLEPYFFNLNNSRRKNDGDLTPTPSRRESKMEQNWIVGEVLVSRGLVF
jgi:hypothetical protein